MSATTVNNTCEQWLSTRAVVHIQMDSTATDTKVLSSKPDFASFWHPCSRVSVIYEQETTHNTFTCHSYGKSSRRSESLVAPEPTTGMCTWHGPMAASRNCVHMFASRTVHSNWEIVSDGAQGHLWSTDAISSMLRAIKSIPAMATLMSSSIESNRAVWEDVAVEMAECGHPRNVAQLQVCWKAKKAAFHKHCVRHLLTGEYRRSHGGWMAKGRLNPAHGRPGQHLPMDTEARLPQIQQGASVSMRGFERQASPSHMHAPTVTGQGWHIYFYFCLITWTELHYSSLASHSCWIRHPWSKNLNLCLSDATRGCH